MPNQTIPLTLSWGPVATDVRAEDINQLGKLIARQLAASLRADVTFIPVLTNDPATNEGQLIFNVTQNIFKSWDVVAGDYRAVSSFAIGDVKNTFVGVDAISTGWIILNGRKISDISGLSGSQVATLQSLFGAGAEQRIPNVTPANVSGMPAGNAFGSIPWPPSINPTYLPAEDTFANLPFTNPVTDAEATALADNCEILRSSGDAAFTVTKQIQALCQQVLNALNTNTTPPLYASLFIGYP